MSDYGGDDGGFGDDGYEYVHGLLRVAQLWRIRAAAHRRAEHKRAEHTRQRLT